MLEAEEKHGPPSAINPTSPQASPASPCSGEPLPTLADEPWTTRDILSRLADAADLLLNQFNYTGDRWEEIEGCMNRARQLLSQNNNDQQP